MTSKLTVKNIEGLTSGAGNDTVIIRTGNADRVTVTNTTVTMSDNQTVSGDLTVLGNTNISGSIVGDLTVTGNVVTTAVTQTGGSVIAFRGTTTKTSASYTAETDMTGYTEDFDLGNNFDHTAGTFTVPQNGVYQINFYIVMDTAGPSTTDADVKLYRDATVEYEAQEDLEGGVSGNIGASITLNCTANEVFKISLTASGDTSITLDHVDFSGHLIG